MFEKDINKIWQDTLLIERHKKIPRYFKIRSRAYIVDITNIFRYGTSAPKFAEKIWINPDDCEESVWLGKRLSFYSGTVIEANWPLDRVMKTIENPKIQFCIDHWVNGTPWEYTGIYELNYKRIREKGSYDGYKNMDDVIKRYKNLDIIFEQVKREGRFKNRSEIKPKNFREKGGILIHIGPKGKPYFSFIGCHRFAISYILKVPFPAQIGYVHATAIPYLDSFRKG